MRNGGDFSVTEEAKWNNMKTIERPVSSQLSQIEQDIKAALEGQARLNGLVDGQRVLVSEAFRNVGERIDLYTGFPDALRLLADRLAALEKQITGYQGAVVVQQAGLSYNLKAIEAKLEIVVAHLSAPALTCTVSNYRTRKQLASKKPSHKARR